MNSIPPGVVVTILGLFLFMGLLGGLLYQVAFGPRARLQKRMAAVLGTSQKRGVKLGGVAQQKKRSLKLKDRDDTKKKSFKDKVQEQIAQAGLSWTWKRYLVICAVCGVGATLAYWLFKMPPVGLPFAAVTGALGLPKFFLNFRRKRRVNRFILLFPDALDVIVRGIRSGLPVGECINLIGREMPDPVGTEFRLLAEAQRLGVTMDEAMRRAVERVPNQELRFFAIVLSIQQQTGGNLADTLAKLSDVLRQRKKMRDKVAAMSSEAKASASIIGSLPFALSGLLALISPDYIGLLFSTGTGHTILGIGFGIMAFGIFVMKQMINFEI